MISTRPLRVVIGAGGTGGHIYPGLATADALRRSEPGAVVTFSGARIGLESRLVPAAGYRLDTLPMRPFAGRSAVEKAVFVAHLARCVVGAAKMLRRDHVDVVLGMGGYPSVPVVLAARLLGIPAILHESNAVPGLANEVLARVTRHIATGFPSDDARWVSRSTVRLVGMPLAENVSTLDVDASRATARRAFGVAEGARFVVVSGGSLGASRLNRAAVQLAAAWRERGDVRFLIKARPDDQRELSDELRRSGGDAIASVTPHIERMDLAYAAADAMVLRAGSATIAELQHTGVPAVLVPYPQAAGDHQTHNARLLEATGRASVVVDSDLCGDSLEVALSSIVASPYECRSSTASIHASAADTLAAWVAELARGHRSTSRRSTAPPLSKGTSS